MIENLGSEKELYKRLDACQICGGDLHLERHHIERCINYEFEDNLVTLCYHCHSLIHRSNYDERDYVPSKFDYDAGMVEIVMDPEACRETWVIKKE